VLGDGDGATATLDIVLTAERRKSRRALARLGKLPGAGIATRLLYPLYRFYRRIAGPPVR
jgi:hypothetical protein